MKRTHVLILVVGAVTLSAMGLRVRSHLASREREFLPRPAPESPSEVLRAPPRDYVFDPWVHPAEQDAGPEKIISLAPSITEIVCALGLMDRLVGRTSFCEYPPAVVKVRQVGALNNANVALIESLEAELILATANSREVLEQLAGLGLSVETVPHETLDQVYVAIERIGATCGRPRTAAALVAAIRSDLEALCRSAAVEEQVPERVLVVTDAMPLTPSALWVAGPGSFLDAQLKLAGYRNAVESVTNESYLELPLEKLLTLEVDSIATFGPPLSAEQEARMYADWSRLVAFTPIRERRVRCAGGGEWLSAGPRVAIGLHRLMTTLRSGK